MASSTVLNPPSSDEEEQASRLVLSLVENGHELKQGVEIKLHGLHKVRWLRDPVRLGTFVLTVQRIDDE